jgi:hypothetical protein
VAVRYASQFDLTAPGSDRSMIVVADAHMCALSTTITRMGPATKIKPAC